MKKLLTILFILIASQAWGFELTRARDGSTWGVNSTINSNYGSNLVTAHASWTRGSFDASTDIFLTKTGAGTTLASYDTGETAGRDVKVVVTVSGLTAGSFSVAIGGNTLASAATATRSAASLSNPSTDRTRSCTSTSVSLTAKLHRSSASDTRLVSTTRPGTAHSLPEKNEVPLTLTVHCLPRVQMGGISAGDTIGGIATARNASLR
jgi:hypothetical protein